ncbi:hypothetical protein LWI28_006545 [Acer negundo]|uniref:Uncharacterized protein n=1 Tax=Acer negundo TaxID=4023 RepID=A0AAD5JVN6_ACENE|nr:hypothetical protein LWI28_006545 [Acer negundo]
MPKTYITEVTRKPPNSQAVSLTSLSSSARLLPATISHVRDLLVGFGNQKGEFGFSKTRLCSRQPLSGLEELKNLLLVSRDLETTTIRLSNPPQGENQITSCAQQQQKQLKHADKRYTILRYPIMNA